MQELIDFAQTLQVAVKASQLYAPSHPRCVEAVEGLISSTEALFGGRNRLQIVASNGQLFMERKPVERITPHVTALARQLQERKISGFVLTRGVGERDLRVLLQVLTTKPQRVEELGGASKVLTDAGVSLIKVSHVRYEELRDGEEIVDSAKLVQLDSNDSNDAVTLLNQLFRPMLRTLRATGNADAAALFNPGSAPAEGAASDALPAQPLDPRRAEPLDLSDVEKRLEAAGAFEKDDFEQALASTIEELDPEMQMRLLNSRANLPDGRLRQIIDGNASSIVMNVISALAGDQKTNESFADMVSYLYSQMPHADRSLERLKSRLDALGVDQEQLDDLLAILAWENLSFDEKCVWIAEGRHIFELPAERVLTFFRDLLIQNRHDDFVALVERYGLALQADSPEIRRVALENFAQMAGWGREPGLLPPEETLLQKILFTHFLRETDQKIQQRSIDALSTFIGHWMTSGRSDRATRALNTLNAGTTAAASNLPWKKQTYEALTTRLSREHVRAMSEQLCTRDLETVAADVYPLLTILGSPAAAELIEQLALEDDRARRGRIVRAIKAIGRPALLPLRHSLESTTWYLVRNTLNLLGDLGAVELLEEMGLTLKHEDSRVRRAAARALSKIGGKRAEELLTAELNTNDGELQTELLFCLGSMKAESSVVALGELMKGRKDEVRERVVDTLGQIGSNQAIPILEDVLRKRALLMGGESAEIRIAAAKALAQINTPEAHLVIRKAVENESNSAAKGQMEKLLNA